MDKLSKNIQAYKAIKRLMSTNKLFPGQKLIYRDLEEELAMSKTPIINALMKLEQEGLAVSKRNRGFYIKQIDSSDMIHIFQLRQKLEEIALEFAITNYKEAGLRILKRKMDDYSQQVSRIYDTRRAELDIEFHLYIAQMGRNNFLVPMLRQFYDTVYFSLTFSHLTPLIDHFKADHLAIYNAIKTRNLANAIKIMRAHTERAMEACAQIAEKEDKK